MKNNKLSEKTFIKRKGYWLFMSLVGLLFFLLAIPSTNAVTGVETLAHIILISSIGGCMFIIFLMIWLADVKYYKIVGKKYLQKVSEVKENWVEEK